MTNSCHVLVGGLLAAACVAAAAQTGLPDGIPRVAASSLELTGQFTARDPAVRRPAAATSEDAMSRPGRSFWTRLEVVGSSESARQLGFADAARPALIDGASDPLYSYALTRSEVGIGFSNRGLVGGYVRWRAPSLRESDSSSFVPAPQAALGDMALSTYRGDHRGLCCLPDLAPALSGPHALHMQEAPPMVGFLARLKQRGLDLNLPDAWKINAGVRSRDYSTTLSSRVAHVTVDRLWGDLRTSYAFQLERPGGWSLAPSHKVAIDYALADRSAVGVAFTAGREMAFFENIGAVNTQVRGFAFHAEHSIHNDWSVNFDAGYYNHGAMPAQRAIRFVFRRNL